MKLAIQQLSPLKETMATPRTRATELQRQEIAKMTGAELLEVVERSLSILRWLFFPHVNPSKAPARTSIRANTIRKASFLACASTLREVANRLDLMAEGK